MAGSQERRAVLGMERVIKINGQEAVNVTDVTIKQTCDSVDTTTRETAKLGDKSFQSTLRETTIDFDILMIEGDYTYETLNAAFQAYPPELVDIETEIVKGQFSVADFSVSEPMADACKISVSLKLKKRTG